MEVIPKALTQSETIFFAVIKASAGNKVGSCDITRCEFPFVYKSHSYNKCTTITNDYPWCITNDQLFGEVDENPTLLNGNKGGWSFCSDECLVEDVDDSVERKNVNTLYHNQSFLCHIYFIFIICVG